MTKKEITLKAVAVLKERYPDAACSLVYDEPYQLMIAVRLSAQCTDARVNIVTKPLFQRYTSLKAFADADIAELEEIVKPCGFYKMKAKSIKEACGQLLNDFNGVIPDNMDDLLKLSGVGRKTANLLLGDIYHQPAVVADTHFIRITGKLGLTKEKEPAKVESDLRKLLPPEESSDFCHRVVQFGRDICKARKPLCGECPMKEFCPSVTV